jgi:hypothetical protein
MYKEAKLFFVFSLVLMIIFGYGVRVLLFAPKQPVGGTILTSHDTNIGVCNACHAGQREWHERVFGEFNLDNCMTCHGDAPKTPHAIEGAMATCDKCHADIVLSHSEMFNFPGTSYDDCLACHPAQ